MAVVLNSSHLDVEVDGVTKTIDSNEVQVEVVNLSIVKSAASSWTIQGGTIHYCVAVTNESETETITDAVFRDVLADRLTYVEDSFTVDGDEETPVISGQTISYTIPTLEPEQTVNICFAVTVGPEAP